MVGGGIQGSAVARDASLRGLSVVLLEAGDLASGTSSRTSKLIHGGVRYLETAQFGLVREALREREILLETASSFVRPLPFLIPHYRGEGRPAAWVALGLRLYDAFARGGRLERHRRLGSAEAVALEPTLRRDGLEGASLYWDAQMDDALLNVAVAVDAERAGAQVRTYSRVIALQREGGSWRARYRDVLDGTEGECVARCVVNAAGPWADEVRGLTIRGAGSLMRRTRGSHVVVPAVTATHALLLTAQRDGRAFFVLPWGAYSLIGTTDVDDAVSPDQVAPPSADIRYLLEESARAMAPAGERRRPARAFAGLRALARGRAGRPWSNPREHRVTFEDGLITLVGGKYTTHRSLAERVVDRAVRWLKKPAGPCRTATSPVGAGRDGATAALRSRHQRVLDFGSGLAISEAEVVHAVAVEKARRLADVLLRRTRLWLDAGALRRAAGPVAEWMAPHLRWDEARRRAEVEGLTQALDAEERMIQEGTR